MLNVIIRFVGAKCCGCVFAKASLGDEDEHVVCRCYIFCAWNGGVCVHDVHHPGDHDLRLRLQLHVENEE